MKYCKSCKADNPDDAVFCHMCGDKLYSEKYETFIFVIGLLGMGLVSIGAGLMGYSFWIGLGVLLAGGGMMIWAYYNDKS